MELNEIRVANFLLYIKKLFDNSINKFAKNNKVNVNQYYAIIRGERPFGDKVARRVEQLLGINAYDLDRPETTEKIFIDFRELMKYQEILKEIIDLQNKIIINHDKIKRIIT
ncbi:MAG: hypothetical protein E6Q32_03265 [Neisseriales bacterium]|nr:MAG: hypothetical protein E6Q32_03265 [Neisseriales bacterium]